MNINGLLTYIKDAITSSTYGNAALKVLIDAIQSDATDILVDTAQIQPEVSLMVPVVGDLGDVQLNSQIIVPSAASGVTCTDINDAGGTPWGDGAWQQLSADIGADEIIVRSVDIANAGAGEFEVDIGVGAPAAEARVGGVCFKADGQYLLSCTLIPANARLSARIRSAQATGLTADVKVQGVYQS